MKFLNFWRKQVIRAPPGAIGERFHGSAYIFMKGTARYTFFPRCQTQLVVDVWLPMDVWVVPRGRCFVNVCGVVSVYE